MANRFTATEKWVDPWFCSLNKEDKLFWIYLVDNCDHAGMWQVNWPLVQFHIKDYVFNEKVFDGRIVQLKKDKWFIPKFIDFQYKTGLNPENRAHLSVINLLKKEGAYKGLERGFKARKDKDKDKDKDNKGVVRGEQDFLSSLKTNPAYKHINIDHELAKMDTWLMVHKGRQKTPKFVVNWLNKIEVPIVTKCEPPKPLKIEPIDEKKHKEVADLIHKTAQEMGRR
jgi:hypothetical protein